LRAGRDGWDGMGWLSLDGAIYIAPTVLKTATGKTSQAITSMIFLNYFYLKLIHTDFHSFRLGESDDSDESGKSGEAGDSGELDD